MKITFRKQSNGELVKDAIFTDMGLSGREYISKFQVEDKVFLSKTPFHIETGEERLEMDRKNASKHGYEFVE